MTEETTYHTAATPQASFLKDVLVCSLGAYGGPEAHMGVFLDQLVARRNHVTEEELVELLALCSILPGPTSTQTIVAVGYKKGGPLLAFLTMLVWAAPVLLIMTALSFLYALLATAHVSPEILRFIGPMAVGFILLAAWRIGKKVVTDKLTCLLMVFGAVSTYLVRTPWIFPLVLVAGGAASILASREKAIWNKPRINPPWGYLGLFLLCTAGSLVLSLATDIRFFKLFESFYRYGYLVFGGGQVVVPVMHSELVEVNRYMTNGEFLTGYGLVQGLPGPMFSFAAYAGGMASRHGSTLQQVMGALAGGIGIFLPGLLLIYFICPVWERIKEVKAIKISLQGVNAVAGGMITAAAIILIQANGVGFANLAMTTTTVAILATGKVPAPLMVVMALVAGIVPF
ncbi:chromate efflux transporter [Desulfoluna butyratoxydans]|uniref:Chromate transporter long chain n=1 Tax=Desulfoluna butyratoxydans TaxID=231438 RepID=A0A4U8YTD7_9BACT|nr:chromate efflux transporter [Desulfoluna butyratoxydans]VFQ47104.1 chromate transporter long chain [Desulfoluna butyratoxydans]